MQAYQAITLKDVKTARTQNARVRASCAAGALTWTWNFNLGYLQNYIEAARALALKLGWADREAHIGGLKDGSYVVVFTSGEDTRVLP